MGAEGPCSHCTYPRQCETSERRATPPARLREAPAVRKGPEEPGGRERRQGLTWALCPQGLRAAGTTAGGQLGDRKDGVECRTGVSALLSW